MRTACQPVPMALLCLFALPGCFASHGRAEPAFDGGGPIPVPPPGPVPGPGPVPAPLDAGRGAGCVPAPLDFACSDTQNAAIPVGVEGYPLRVYFGGADSCFCGEELGCTATLGRDGALELWTQRCTPDVLCDDCDPFVEGRCALPALTEGVWHVRVNGNDAFDLTVSEVFPEAPVDACLTHPRGDECGWTWGPRREGVDQICHPIEVPAAQPIVVRATDFCMPCGAIPGPCEVVWSVGSVHVQPSHLLSGCDVDCTDECTFTELECVVPPLPPGDYQVTVDGLPGHTELHVLSGPRTRPPGAQSCLSLPED